MIIIGYPCVGKSTLAENCEIISGYKGVIDLESSCFHEEGRMDPLYEKNHRNPDWHVSYCKTALDLSRQGYAVFVSSHGQVCQFLTGSVVDIKIVHPALSLKEEWLKRLRNRYRETGLDKDYRAYERAMNNYENDIKALMNYGFDRIEINSMDYDLCALLDAAKEGPKCIGY
jgi:hypothetical protein